MRSAKLARVANVFEAVMKGETVKAVLFDEARDVFRFEFKSGHAMTLPTDPFEVLAEMSCERRRATARSTKKPRSRER